MTAERRRFPRKKRRYLVEFQGEGASGTGFTYDLSPIGIFIRSIRLPRPGTSVTASLALPDGKRLPLTGRVVRSYRTPAALTSLVPSGFSVSLSDLPEDYYRFLSTL